ncbi:MAG: hypothetical protein SGJ09_16395 [Phycisphaerae bacterium]|nr:hypothetical protein [Phycisphaerae bacterium]
MPPAELYVVIATGFVGAIVLLIAIVGRQDLTRAMCAKCRRDAAPFVWRDPRRCDCGADLAAPRAIRSRGRVRRRWAVVNGALLIALSIAIVIVGAWMRTTKRGWSDALPTSVLMYGLERGDDWAAESLWRRMSRNALREDEAEEILGQFAGAPPVRSRSFQNEQMLGHLALAAPAISPARNAALASMVANLISVPLPVRPGQRVALAITRASPMLVGYDYFLRLDSATLDGAPIGLHRGVSPYFPSGTTAFITFNMHIEFDPPANLAAGKHEIRLRCVGGWATPSPISLVGHSRAETAPIEEWQLIASGGPLEIVVPFVSGDDEVGATEAPQR